MSNYKLLQGDVLEMLRQLPAESVHCVVTSVPYLWQRDYGVQGQIGHEPTIPEYIAKLVEVFREVRRVMRPDGTLWLNIADGYVNDTKWGGASGHKNDDSAAGGYMRVRRERRTGLPEKCLMGIPARLQIAMIDDGWVCRNEIIWHKPTARPESASDRCSRDHEQVFLFTRRGKYYFDQEAVKQPASPKTATVKTHPRKGNGTQSAGERWSVYQDRNGQYSVEERNLRTVWSIPAEPSSEEHYAAFPSALPTLCIQAGASEYGCCVACGAPWRRVLERVKGTPARFNGSSFNDGKTGKAAASFSSANGRDHVVGSRPRMLRVETKGWKPSCRCNERKHRADCVVLDPFAGTSTTGVAALRLGRRFVGIELNPDYVAISRRRLRQAEENAIGVLFLPALSDESPSAPSLFAGIE